jgi:endogenous inhibitor of DNA gyrase (YacG/DUF329 family)
MIDLGRWFDETYSIPAEENPDDDSTSGVDHPGD